MSGVSFFMRIEQGSGGMKIVVVYGAPMSGKTTYVRNAMTEYDLVFDYDALIHAMTSTKYQQHNDNAHTLVMSMRDKMIDHAKQSDNGVLYIVTTFLSYKLMSEVDTHFNTQYKRMDTSLDECKKRIHDSDRPNKEHVMQVIHEWYGKYIYNKNLTDSDELSRKSKALYNSKDWENIKAMAFERDNHLCQICLRKNRNTKANLVHHIIYVKSDYEKALDLDNLMCVCSACHNKIHSKDEKEVFAGEEKQKNVRVIKV